MKKVITLLLFSWLLGVSAWAQDRFEITHGPYLQALSTTSVSVLWTTNKPAISWIELAPDDGTHFYNEERPKYFMVDQGLKTKDTLQHIRLDGLQPGTTYRYRVFSQEVKGHQWNTVTYGTVAATQVYRAEPLRFTTPTPSQPAISFAVINDIHGHNDVMERLLAQVAFGDSSLVFFNGDMASFFLDQSQIFTDFMDTGAKLFAAQYPMYYARGNHETRGQFAGQYSNYFPTVSGKPYYLLRRGPVCFVVLDSGEDKPDTDIEYGGLADFDAYRTEQAAWLEEALQRPEYTNAPYKVAICHMPPFNGWHGPREVAEKFVPLLNKAGIQLMISGHLHRHIKRMPNVDAHRFPVLVNSNKAILQGSADSNRLLIEVRDEKGDKVDSMTLYPDKR